MKKSLCFLILLVLMTSGIAWSQNESQDTVLKGTIVAPDYEQGYILVGAFDNFERPLNLIVEKHFSGPGEYELLIPAVYNTVYIKAYNDKDNDGPPKQENDPAFMAETGLKTPILTNKSEVEINIIPFVIEEEKEETL